MLALLWLNKLKIFLQLATITPLSCYLDEFILLFLNALLVLGFWENQQVKEEGRQVHPRWASHYLAWLIFYPSGIVLFFLGQSHLKDNEHMVSMIVFALIPRCCVIILEQVQQPFNTWSLHSRLLVSACGLMVHSWALTGMSFLTAAFVRGQLHWLCLCCQMWLINQQALCETVKRAWIDSCSPSIIRRFCFCSYGVICLPWPPPLVTRTLFLACPFISPLLLVSSNGRLTFVLPLPLLLLAARLWSGAGRGSALFGRARLLGVRSHLHLLLVSFLH